MIMKCTQCGGADGVWITTFEDEKGNVVKILNPAGGNPGMYILGSLYRINVEMAPE